MSHFRPLNQSALVSPSNNKFMRMTCYLLFQETDKFYVRVTSNSKTFIAKFVKIGSKFEIFQIYRHKTKRRD